MPIWRTVVRTRYAANGGPGYSTFHFRDGGLATVEAQLQNATSQLEQAYILIRGQVPSTTIFDTDGKWQDVGGDTEVDVAGWSAAGTASGGFPFPGNVAIVVGWRTASRSRSGRGRTFLSGWNASADSDGTPPAARLAQCQAFGDLIAGVGGENDGAFQVYSPTQGVGRDISSAAVRDVYASLRSRRD